MGKRKDFDSVERVYTRVVWYIYRIFQNYRLIKLGLVRDNGRNTFCLINICSFSL